MAVAKLQKIRLICHKQKKEEVLDFLHTVGVMHVELETKEGEVVGEASTLEYDLAEVKFAIDFLTPFEVIPKQSLSQKLDGKKIRLTKKEFKKAVSGFDCKNLLVEIKKVDEDLNYAESESISEQEKVTTYKKWIPLHEKLSAIKDNGSTKFILAEVPQVHYDFFLEKFDQEVKLAEVKKVNSLDGFEQLLIIVNEKFREQAVNVLSEFAGLEVDLPKNGKTPKELVDIHSRRAKSSKKEIEKLNEHAINLAENLQSFRILFDYLTWQQEKEEVQKGSVMTDSTVAMTGWIRAKAYGDIKKDLAKITKLLTLKKIKPKKDEETPVLLENKSVIRPFEAVTNIYGAPKSSEIDPTFWLAPFFIVFFGLALTDAGYGIVLALFAFIGMKVMKVPGEKQRLWRLLIYGGISTFVIGILFGGWFGIVLDDLPDSIGFIRDFLLSLRMIDPVADPITFMILSFALGILHVLTGIAIDIVWKIKNKDYVDAILDSGLWFYFIVVLLLFALAAVGVLPESFSGPAKIAVLIGAGLLVVTQGRKSKNIVAKAGIGALSLYNIVGYFSDILSYSRLLALGLATGIIAMVVNLIAVMFKEMIPVVGWVVMILVLVGGHLFNLTINALGAFIHSGRLQFVEFFPKFMEGGGSRFKPFVREGKYVIVS
ncbi:MAG: V-type ATP synthase subunit I [bacterium]